MKLYDNDAYRCEFMDGVYSLLSDDPTWDRANQIIDLFDAAPVAESESNEPLTLDELREMDGAPVWIVNVSAINQFKGHWDICDWENGERVIFPYCMEEPNLDDYDPEEKLGIAGWRAYRRKPEEGAK